MFTDDQREHLFQLAFSIAPDAYLLDDHELLITSLIAAYCSGMRAEDIGPLFVEKWGINRKVVLWGLVTVIASWEKTHKPWGPGG